MKVLILIIFLSGCSTLDRTVGAITEGHKAVAKDTAREQAQKEIAPLSELVKGVGARIDVVIRRMNLVLEDTDRMRNDITRLDRDVGNLKNDVMTLRNVWGDFSKKTNRFILKKLAVVRNFEKRLTKLERRK